MDKATVKKAMEATISLLSQISIPMTMFDQIGIPIKQAINNLHIGIDAFNKEEPDEPEIKIEEINEEG